jgi:LPS export ABC transporter protein LptC
MKQRAWRIVKWISLAISAGSVILAIMLIWLESPTELAPTPADKEQPQTRVENPVVVERKDGQIVWQLRAEEAKQQLNGKMHLSKPKLLLFTKDELKIPIESEQAWFDPLQRNIRFQGNVIIHYEAWDLYAEVMIYDNSKDEMYIPETFRIKGETLRAHGEDLRLNRQTEHLTVDKGIWIEDSNPQWQGVTP